MFYLQKLDADQNPLGDALPYEDESLAMKDAGLWLQQDLCSSVVESVGDSPETAEYFSTVTKAS